MCLPVAFMPECSFSFIRRLMYSGSTILSGRLWPGIGGLFGQCAAFGYEGLRSGLFGQFTRLRRHGLFGLFGQCAAFGYQGLRPRLSGELTGLRSQRLGELVAGLFGSALGKARIIVGHASEPTPSRTHRCAPLPGSRSCNRAAAHICPAQAALRRVVYEDDDLAIYFWTTPTRRMTVADRLAMGNKRGASVLHCAYRPS